MFRLGSLSFITVFLLSFSAMAGGMYLPLEGKLPAKEIKKLGIKLTPREIEKIGQNAVVRLSGCSSTFMSANGILGTNWHCAAGCVNRIERMSILKNGKKHPLSNISRTGYVAKSYDKELKCEGQEARVPYEISNVSDQFKKILENKKLSAKARAEAMRKRREIVREECMKKDEKIVCDVVFMNNDPNPLYLFKYRRYTDVRLVWAIPDIIGGFGGSIDNWEYPRHSGDFAFLRVYDRGKPVKPKVFASASSEGIAPGDPQFILGYPGSTERNITSFAAEFLSETELPYMHHVYGELMDTIKEVTGNPKESAYKSSWNRLDNYFENFQRKADQIRELDVVGNKRKQERGKRGPEFKKIRKIIAESYPYFPTLYILGRLTGAYPTNGLRAASYIWQWSTQPPDDKDRPNDAFKSWNKEKVKFTIDSADDSITYEGEKKLAATYFRLADALRVRIPTIDRLRDETRETMKTAPRKSKNGMPAYETLWKLDLYEQMAEVLYSRTKILAKNTSKKERARAKVFRMKMFKMSPEKLVEEGDRLVLFAKNLVKDKKDLKSDLEKAAPYVYELPFSNYKQNLVMHYPTPDANFTLRFTASTVQKTYNPVYKKGKYRYATTVAGLIKKDKKLEKTHPEYSEFLVPSYLKKAHTRLPSFKNRFFFDRNLGDIPVNFITQHIITGGNSGSGVFNAKGKVVGFAFDGTPESILDDVQLHPRSRTIAVDIRYVGFLGNEVFPAAKRILKEIGLPTY